MFAIARIIRTRCGKTLSASRFQLAVAGFSIALLACASSANAAPSPTKVNLPPSAELSYSIKAQQSGLNVKGEAVTRWHVSGNRYETSTETNAALFGKMLETHSEGIIEPAGLAPVQFREQRYRKREAITQFDRSAGTVTFSESGQSLPLQPGIQDRSSVVWQLISIARTTPARFKPGFEWTTPVTGRRQAEPWTFKVVRSETVQTALGEMQAVHLQKTSASHRDQEIDIWLAPSLQWYPVKLRYSDRDGATIEQTLRSVK